MIYSLAVCRWAISNKRTNVCTLKRYTRGNRYDIISAGILSGLTDKPLSLHVPHTRAYDYIRPIDKPEFQNTQINRNGYIHTAQYEAHLWVKRENITFAIGILKIQSFCSQRVKLAKTRLSISLSCKRVQEPRKVVLGRYTRALPSLSRGKDR